MLYFFWISVLDFFVYQSKFESFIFFCALENSENFYLPLCILAHYHTIFTVLQHIRTFDTHNLNYTSKDVYRRK